MAIYRFKNTKTNEYFEKHMTYQEKLSFLEENPDIVSILSAPNFIYNAGTQPYKVDDGFRESISRVKEKLGKYHKNNIPDHY